MLHFSLGPSVRPQTTSVVGLFLLWTVAFQGTAQDSMPVNSPLSPDASLDHIIVAPGLQVQIVAHEPQVVDPVAMRFDEEGCLWVVEMRDYPHGPPDGELPRSRISILSDRDGDGRFETATVFADNLLFATGIQPWQGGVFVTLAGQVSYMKDTTGDDRADLVEIWYTGFAQDNPQLRANHPRWALDNNIYIANGLSGGAIVDARLPDQEPVSISGMDFRFDPRTRKFEVVSGAGQFGLTFDDYGNRFVCSNRNPVIHIVLENQYLEKNPLVTVPAVRHDVASTGAASRVFPIARAWTTSNLHAGQFTAACGVEVYRGDALPKEFYGNVFTCDPTGHLIHRERVQQNGVTFTSQPAREGIEFFASRDEWCTPVNLEVGPDGALYVVDIYRAVIEHPNWMPTELRDRTDLYEGNDRGRIYRIVPLTDDRTASVPQLSDTSSESLINNLAHPNAWWRETSARLLIERDDKTGRDVLKRVAMGHASPLARIHALWVMQGLDLISDELLQQVFDDRDPRVIEQAIAVAEGLVAEPGALRDKVAQFCDHDDPRVRYRATLAIAPHQVVPRDYADSWELSAMLIATGNLAGDVLSNWLQSVDETRPAPSLHLSDPRRWIVELAGLAAATGDEQQHLQAVTALLAESEFRRAGLIRFFADAARRGASFDAIRGKLDEKQQAKLDRLLDEARMLAMSRSESEATRVEAIELLALHADAATTLARLSLDDLSTAVRLAAMEALAARTDLEPWRQLLGKFSLELPVIRRRMLDGILRRSERTALLLDELAAGRINSWELEQSRIDRLLNYSDAQIKDRAQQLLADAVPADREAVLSDYQAVLAMETDPQRGREVFQKQCATCHRIDNVGVDVAPDISDSRGKTPQQYLTDIIQPNRAIDNNYVNYTLHAEDGQVFNGILATETSTSVTLKQAGGKTITFRRDEIEELRSSGASLMPDGLEKQIPHQDMADLIAFIKNWRYLDGRTPLRKN